MFSQKNTERRSGPGRAIAALASAAAVVASLLLATSPATAVAAAASAPVGAADAADPQASGQWSLDEGSGTTSADSSGGGHDVTLRGGASWVASPGGKAVDLNGSTGYLDSGASLLPVSQSFTVAAYVRLDSLPSHNATVAGQDSTSGHGAFFLQYLSSNKRFAFATTGVTVIDSGAAPVAGRWYQLVGVYDADAKTISLYVNGALAATHAAGTTVQDGQGDLVFGRGQFGGSATDFWPGAVDEASAFRSALTADQVAALASNLIGASSAQIDATGTTVHLTMSAPLTAVPSGAASAFSITSGPNTIAVTAVAADPSDLASLVLTTASPVPFASYTVTTAVDYDGTGGLTVSTGTVPAFSLGGSYVQNDDRSSTFLPTPWTEQVDDQNPLPDYPRPQLTRPDWQSLNGAWQFEGAAAALTPSFGAELPGQIVVPYPMESTLSTVGKHYDHSLYRRTFTVPADWNVGASNRLLLNFGAVDYQATVYVNGTQVATHTGGYTAFTADVTAALKPGAAQELVVAVTDTTTVGQALGKQSASPSGSTYTPTSGIWQTVWMEPVPTAHIDSVTITPDALDSRIEVTVNSASSTAGAVAVDVQTSDDAANCTGTLATGRTVASGTGTANTSFAIHVKDAQLWTPDDPYLYNLRITLRDGASVDTVGSYTGIRSIGVTKVDGANKVVLNGKPIFLLGTLDQGFYPDGLYTAPTDDALKFPLQSMKDLGFNIDRAHLKVDPARYYYWADKLGMMVMQDAPATAYYGGPAPSAANLAQWQAETDAMVKQLISSPSVVIWTPYNEHDGESSVAVTTQVVADITALDPSRLVDANSGANVGGVADTGAGDILDDHAYPGPANPKPDASRAAMDGEHGGLRLSTPGHVWTTPGSGDPVLCVAASGCPSGTTTIAQQTQRYLGVTTPLVDLAASTLSGAILSQDNDVESETGGLYTYDRKVLKVDADTVRAVNAQVLAAGATGTVDDPPVSQPAATTVHATPTSDTVAQGGAFAVHVTVSAADGSTPDGAVTAELDGAAAGDPVALAAGAGELSLSTAGLAPGSHTLVIHYPGSDGFAPSSSTPIGFTVTKPVAPAWSPTTVYTAGEQASYRGDTYTAAWWTQGETPGASPYGAWEQQGAAVVGAPDGALSWTPSWIYLGGETVAHNGHLWQAKWWTRDQAPGDPNGPWQDLGAY